MPTSDYYVDQNCGRISLSLSRATHWFVMYVHMLKTIIIILLLQVT